VLPTQPHRLPELPVYANIFFHSFQIAQQLFLVKFQKININLNNLSFHALLLNMLLAISTILAISLKQPTAILKLVLFY
jgi:hypothetical protein